METSAKKINGIADLTDIILKHKWFLVLNLYIKIDSLCIFSCLLIALVMLYLHKCIGVHLQLRLQELNLKFCSMFLLLLGCLIEGYGKSTVMIGLLKVFQMCFNILTYIQIQV